MNDTVFRQRISSIMTDNMYERRVRGRTRGDLDMRSLYKVGIGSKSVFTQKSARRGKQYNIVLLIDESGSMGHPGWGEYKIDKAADAAVYLTTQFTKLNINVAVVGFNKSIYIHKPFEISSFDSGKMWKQICDRANGDDWEQFRDQLGSTSDNHDIACNHDFDAIAEGYKMLYNKRGTNLLIALSDGMPNCDYDPSYESDKHRFERIKALIRDNTRIAKTIGIGVLYECTQFPDRIQVNDLSELKNKLAEILKKEIKRQ